MGTTIIDKNGAADVSFHNIPLLTVKKATFLDKAKVLHDLLKMTVHGITYDFTKTAQDGAVVFGRDYKNWDFVAPDGRLDLEGYSSMTIGEALASMEAALTANPIPAWDAFAVWLGKNNLKSMTGSLGTTYLLYPNGSVAAQVNALSFPAGMTNFLDILGMLQDCLSPASGQAMSLFADGSGYTCKLKIGSTITMNFTFRE